MSGPFAGRLAGIVAVAAALGLVPRGVSAQQEAYHIRGRVVTAESDAPLASAQVTLRGTTLGTITNAEGAFDLEAPVAAGNYTLEVASLGRSTVTRRLALGADHSIFIETVRMEETAIELNALVVTGAGTPSARREVGNSIETVSGQEVAQAPAASAIDQALQGKVTGAVISENSGQPGGGTSIRLRGTASINGGAEPLIVVDGVIVDNSSDALVSLGSNSTTQGAGLTNRLADIPPEDIDHIEVVKGAAAAALYGSRANNGVIQIFTKRGKQGEPRITVGSDFSIANTPKKYDLYLNGPATLADVTWGGADSVGAAVERFDIQDQIWDTGYGTSNHVTISGGQGGTDYYVSGTYRDEGGIIRSTGYNRGTARVKLGQQIGDRLDLTLNGSVVNSTADFVPEGEQTQGVLTSVIFTPTSWDFRYDENLGRYPYNPILGVNPLTAIDQWKADEKLLRFTGNVEATWRPLDHVSLKYLGGLDDYRQENTYLRPPLTQGASFTGEIQNPVRVSKSSNHDFTLNYDHDFSDAIGLNSTVGTRYTQTNTDIIRASATDLPPGQTTVGGATQFASEGVSEFRTFGTFIQERLAMNDRLFVTGALNYEASSAFGKDQRWQLFPKIGASYILSDEPAFQNSGIGDLFSSLRLRASYGETGGQPPALYSNFDNYINVGYGGNPGLVPSSVAGNPDLKPEREREYEAGFDAGFFDSRLELEATYYDQQTKDLVLSVPLAVSSGFQSQLQNIGELTNKGLELALNTVNMRRDNFVWRSRLQYATNRNRVTKLVTDSDTLITRYLNAVIEGQPVGVFYGGIYARDANGNIVYDANGRALRGRDTLSDGSSVNAARIIGDPNPDFTLSFSNTVEIGSHLQLSALLDGRFGNDVANFTRRISEYFGADAIVAREQNGDTVPRTYALNPNGRISIYEEYIEDGSFVKLREISARYRFDSPWVRRAGMEHLDLRLSGRNLYTWTDYRGLDPEVNLFSANTVARGVDFATTPVPRTFVIGFEAAF